MMRNPRLLFPSITSAALLIVSGAMPAQAHWCSSGAKLTQIEQAICSDANLIRKDIELNRHYSALGGSRNTSLKATQRQWLRERNSCTSMGCLHQAYDIQLKALRDVVNAFNRPALPAPAPSPPVVTYTPPPALPPPVVSVPPAAPSGTQSQALENLPNIKPF